MSKAYKDGGTDRTPVDPWNKSERRVMDRRKGDRRKGDRRSAA